MRSPHQHKPPLQNKDNSHSFSGSLNDHSHTGLNLQIKPCLNQHIPQSILNRFPFPLITLITSTYLLANAFAGLWDDYHLAMKGRGYNLIRVQYCFAQLQSDNMYSFFIIQINCFNSVECQGKTKCSSKKKRNQKKNSHDYYVK